MEKLQAGGSQAFITTHSPAILAAASKAALWYVDHEGRIGRLRGPRIERHRELYPDAFLSRLTVIGEGATEVGFAAAMLERALGSPLQQHGLHISDGGGHDNTVFLLEALAEGGLRFGGFADDEGKHSTRWERVAKAVGPLLFRWESGCLERNIIDSVPDDKLEELLIDQEGKKTGNRLRSLAERVGIVEKDFGCIKAQVSPGLKAVIIEAALGMVPADKVDEEKHYRSHARDWFKTELGGRELATKVFSLGLWPTFQSRLLPFCNAVRAAIDLPALPDLQL